MLPLHLVRCSLSLLADAIVSRPLYRLPIMARNIAEDNWRLMSAAELPPCDGPKLQAFKHRSARIRWGDCIGGIGDEDEDSGSQAFVFKVEIKAKIYALKVVC